MKDFAKVAGLSYACISHFVSLYQDHDFHYSTINKIRAAMKSFGYEEPSTPDYTRTTGFIRIDNQYLDRYWTEEQERLIREVVEGIDIEMAQKSLLLSRLGL